MKTPIRPQLSLHDAMLRLARASDDAAAAAQRADAPQLMIDSLRSFAGDCRLQAFTLKVVEDTAD